MLDIKRIRQNPEEVAAAVARRGKAAVSETFSHLLELDAQRRAKSLAASDADGSVFAANVPATMFDPAWNLMRVTTRGGVPPSGVVVSRTAVLGYGITVR